MSSQHEDVDIFDSFDDMDADSQPPQPEEPITLDSDDSFEAEPRDSAIPDRASLLDKYQRLKEESRRLDELAIEVRSLLTICKQMEECYSKRINRKDALACCTEFRHLHDGTALLLITIHNITTQPMNDWLLSIYPSPILPASSSSSAVFACQTIPLGSLLPGTRKTFECHVAQDEPPILLELGLIREFEIDDVRKVFHVQMDPICVTLWDQVQIVRADVNSSFTYRIRLPNTLIDLLSGCPDTVVIPSQVIKAIFNVTADSETVLCITSPSPLPILVKITCSKDGGTAHALTISTENSRILTVLAEQLRLRLIVEVSKLKSRPAKRGILVLPGGMELAGSVEELFLSIIAEFQ